MYNMLGNCCYSHNNSLACTRCDLSSHVFNAWKPNVIHLHLPSLFEKGETEFHTCILFLANEKQLFTSLANNVLSSILLNDKFIIKCGFFALFLFLLYCYLTNFYAKIKSLSAVFAYLIYKSVFIWNLICYKSFNCKYSEKWDYRIIAIFIDLTTTYHSL